jgi:hypothetical protein
VTEKHVPFHSHLLLDERGHVQEYLVELQHAFFHFDHGVSPAPQNSVTSE